MPIAAFGVRPITALGIGLVLIARATTATASATSSGACADLYARRIRRSIHRAPTVSVRPWARIEARITKAATSKTSAP